MKAHINLSWHDSVDPRQGSNYLVATFHTHTPFLCGSGKRAVGPSGMDEVNLSSYVSFVYDYVGKDGWLPCTHGVNDPAKVYHFGLERGKY